MDVGLVAIRPLDPTVAQQHTQHILSHLQLFGHIVSVDLQPLVGSGTAGRKIFFIDALSVYFRKGQAQANHIQSGLAGLVFQAKAFSHIRASGLVFPGRGDPLTAQGLFALAGFKRIDRGHGSVPGISPDLHGPVIGRAGLKRDRKMHAKAVRICLGITCINNVLHCGIGCHKNLRAVLPFGNIALGNPGHYGSVHGKAQRVGHMIGFTCCNFHTAFSFLRIIPIIIFSSHNENDVLRPPQH